MAAKTIRLHEFERLVRQHNCTIRKTTKEWEIVDNIDGRWLCGFATVSGREVKVTYVKNFQRQLAVRRAEQDPGQEPEHEQEQEQEQ